MTAGKQVPLAEVSRLRELRRKLQAVLLALLAIGYSLWKLVRGGSGLTSAGCGSIPRSIAGGYPWTGAAVSISGTC
jgi:hypothetical protein